jgi:membrane protein implicated in regulation of membrane protease activity
MIFNIPQFIDKEDKIVGPFTAKQLGWFAAGVAIILVLYAFLDTVSTVIAGIPVVLAVLAFAFLKPNGQPLIYFVIYSVFFLFRPKMFIWKRQPELLKPVKKTVKKIEPLRTRKELTDDRIKEIAKLLDRQQAGN